MRKSMDFVFVSKGRYNSRTEECFQAFKLKYPNIKRIHGLSLFEAKKFSSQIVDSSKFCLIDAISSEKIIKTICLKKEKFTPQKINFRRKKPDIIYLTYKEKNAEETFVHLLKLYPNIKRLHGIKGLTRAFRCTAEITKAPFYILIDGDNDVLDNFNLFTIPKPEPNQMNFCMTINPVNGLVYGYGGIKMCPTINFRCIKNDKIDPIASGGIKKAHGLRDLVASITRFNTSPFDAWKAGFREVVMLCNQDYELKMNEQSLKNKISIWKTKGNSQPYGKYTILGAKDGEKYGKKFKGNFLELDKINNPDWLFQKFKELHPDEE